MLLQILKWNFNKHKNNPLLCICLSLYELLSALFL